MPEPLMLGFIESAYNLTNGCGHKQKISPQLFYYNRRMGGGNMLASGVPAKEGFSFKRYPRCGGNIFMDKDIYGWYEQCLQCGRSSDLPEFGEFLKQKSRSEKISNQGFQFVGF